MDIVFKAMDYPWFWGNDETDADSHGWFLWNATARTHAVGAKQPNPFGLFDMTGNVAEMTIDRHGTIVWRGGSAGYTPWHARSAAREYENHGDPTHRNGFRLLCEVPVKRRQTTGSTGVDRALTVGDNLTPPHQRHSDNLSHRPPGRRPISRATFCFAIT